MAKSAKAVSEQSQPLPATYEDAMAELEALVARMESGQMPLEQSLVAYRRGVELTKFCQQKLAAVEQQVKVLEGDLLKPYNGDLA